MDSDLRDIAPNDYPYSFNHSSTPDNYNSLVGKNRKGTIALRKDLPSGTNKCVCSVYWIEKKANIYFVKNSNNNHCIRVLYSNYTIEDILFSEPKLNFSVPFFANIIGDLLTWTDGIIEPRALLISKAIEYTKSYKWNFTNIGTATAQSGVLSNYFFSNTINSTFQVGDKIFIQQDDGYLEEGINGYATIIQVGIQEVYINKYIQITGGLQNGKMFYYNKDKQYYKIDDVILNAIKQPPLCPPIPNYEYAYYDKNKSTARTDLILSYFPTSLPSNLSIKTEVRLIYPTTTFPFILANITGIQSVNYNYNKNEYLIAIKNAIESATQYNVNLGVKVYISGDKLTISVPDNAGDTWNDYKIEIRTSFNIQGTNLPVPPLFDTDYNNSYQGYFSKQYNFYGFQPIIRTNNLRGNLFQFIYRYKYDDNAYSVWSPLSKVSLPNGEQLSNGVFNSSNINNTIKIELNTGSLEVKEIDIAIRQSGLTKYTKIQTIRKYDENGDFILDELTGLQKYPSNTIFNYYFYNSEYGVVLDDAEVTRLFDYIPRTAGCQEILHENVLTYADIKEGFDSIKTDVELSYNILSTDIGTVYKAQQYTSVQNFQRNYRWGSSPLNQTNFPRNESVIAFDFSWINIANDKGKTINIKLSERYLISGTVPVNPVYGYIEYVVSHSINSNDTIETIITSLLNQINALQLFSAPESVYVWNLLQSSPIQPPASVNPNTYWKTRAMRYSTMPDDNTSNPQCPDNISDPFSFQMVRLGYLFLYCTSPDIAIMNSRYDFYINNGVEKKKSFKIGASHKLGTVYYDEAGNRCSDTNSINKLYVPILSELSAYKDKILNAVPYVNISAKINHIPPITAYKWQFVYAGSNIDFKLCFGIKNLVVHTTTPVKTIKISFGIDDMQTAYPNCKDVITNYTFQKGDRIRFLYHKVGSSYYNHNKLYDFEIQSQLSGGEIIVENFFDSSVSFPAWIGDVIEIYHPLKQSETQSEIYYEIGECYDVLNPYTEQRTHGCNITNQTSSNAGICEINSGDVYSFLRFTPNVTQQSFPCQSEHYSDYYISNINDKGRPIVDIWNAKQLDLGTMIRVGGKYLQNTKTNNLFRFISSDYRNSSESFGKIHRIIQRGLTLKVFQDKIVDSYYIGATSLTDLKNENSLVKSDEILGNRRSSEMDYGCIHPHSIQKSDNYIYYYDFNNGIAVIDSEGGGTIISNLKVSSYFKKIKEILLNADSFDVISGFNEQTKEYLLTFIWTEIVEPISSEEDSPFTLYHTETIVFSENDKGWKTFMSHSKNGLPVEMYGKLNDKYISFNNGQPFVHEQNELRNFNFETQQKHIINIVSNIDKEKIKIFNTIELHTNNNKIQDDITKNWKSDNIVIPLSTMYPLGMFSKLYPTQLVSKEGFVTTNFNKNINSNMDGTEKYKLINGDELRGEAINIELENSSSDNVEIYSAIIQSTYSEKSV